MPPATLITPRREAIAARNVAIAGAVATMIGVLLSGPISMLVVEVVHPQPAWRDAPTFALHYRPVQVLPYLTGLVMLGGFLAMIAGLHAMAPPARRPWTRLGLLFAGMYASLVGINYVIQSTFLPGLVSDDPHGHAPMIAALTMVNPRSLGWALEMWGYGFLGVATWLVAPVFLGGPRGRITARAFALNGVISVAGTLATVATPGWLFSRAGYVSFGAWNLLVVAMCGLALINLRSRPWPSERARSA